MKDGFPLRLVRATVLSVLTSLLVQAAPVKAWSDSIRLPTYLEADADLLPNFAAFTAEAASYPYPMRNRPAQDRQERTWQLLNLENEYLVCRILPEIGAHLYGCRDKRNGREVFYTNPVIKKAPFGTRGAWMAMGIESNFPVVHARMTASPADYAVRTEADGSARAVMEDVDRVTGMQWRVEYILRPGSTVLEQRVKFYNRGFSRRPYLWWANAAVSLDDPAMRFVLPAMSVSGKGGAKRETWPIDSTGKDESLVSTHSEAMEWFAEGCSEPFFAVYKPTSRSGVAHYADAMILPGKDLRLWGSAQEKTILTQVTDNFPLYGELRAGLFQNQETSQFLEPEERKTFSEYWIPVHDLGGISRVNRDAIVNLQRRSSPGPSLLAEVSVTHPVTGASVRLLSDGKVAFETRTNLDPAARFEHIVKAPSPLPYTIQVIDPKGAILLEHTEGRYAASEPDQIQPGAAEAASEDDPAAEESAMLARLRGEELREHWAAAWSGYAAGLRKLPSSVALRKNAGILALTLHRFQDAAALLESVRAVADTDEVLYSHGVALAMLGRDAEAQETLARIGPSAPFAQAAAVQLALLAAKAKNDDAALAAIKPLLSPPGERIRLGAFEVALLRRAGRKDEALRQLALWQGYDPADSMLRFEKILLGTDEPDLWTHLAADAERVLLLADDYIRIGMCEEALRLLGYSYPSLPPERLEPGAVPPAKSPMVAYYRAWCKEQLHQPAADDLSQAAHLAAAYAFPYLPLTPAVLQYALKANPSDATAHYLLGRYLMQGLEVEEAIAEWTKARSLPDAPKGLDDELARARQGSARDLLARNGGLKDLLAPRPLPVPPNNTARVEVPPSVVSAPAVSGGAASQPPPPTPAMQDPVSVASSAMIRASVADNSAFSAFDPKVFKEERQPEEVRRAYIEVQLQKLVAASVVPKLCENVLKDVGTLGDEDKNLPFTFHGFGGYMKAAHFQYYLGIAEANCQDQKSARRRWARVSKMKETLPSVEFVFPLLASARIDPGEVSTRAEASLQTVSAALKKADAGARAPLLYLAGMLLHITGQDAEAADKLREAAESAATDPAVEYLARLGLREIQPAQ